MNSVLQEWRDGRRQRVLWVDFERYAARVFASGGAQWYGDANRYAAALAQARGVIGSQVLAVDVLAPFIDAWQARRDPALAALAAAAAADPAGAVEALLQCAGPAGFVAEAVDALSHRLGGKADLVLKLRSPRELLGALVPDHPGLDDFGVLDDTAAAQVNYVRTLADKRFAALQLASEQPDGYGGDEREACESILQSVRYYGWVMAVSAADDAQSWARDADLLLSPADLDAAFWLADAAAPAERDGIRYGVVPDAAVPERVTERAAALRAWLSGRP